MSLSTLAISKGLEANGFTIPQSQILAETIVEAVESDNKNLVTKDYLKAELMELKMELKSDIAALETKMAGFETRVIQWMIGLQFSTIGLVVGLIYFLLRH